jgi:putative inorganic carbon (hco3(-)) transporter
VLVTVSISFSVLRSGTLEVITGTVLAVLVAQMLIVKAARSWAAVRTMLVGAVASALILAATVMSTRLADTTGLRAGYSQSYDPNDFAFVLVGLWPLVVSFCVLSRGRARLVYFGAALWVLVALLLTQSRGGFLGLLADVALLVFLLPVVRKGKVDFHPSKAAIVVRIGFLAIVGMLAWQFVPNAARARLETVSQLGSDYNVSVGHGGRLEIWSRTLPLAVSRPWGYGAGGFETADGMFAGGRFRAPHNTFLQALIELGVLGFGLFIAIIVKSLRYLGRVSSELERPQQHALELQLFARALGICLVGLCVSGFFLSQLYSNILWTIVALTCALGFVIRRSASRVDTRANTRRAPDGLPFKTVG